MSGLGNPLAFELGGGPSEQEQAYDVLKAAVGEGNSAPGDVYDSIIEAWRWSRARGLVASYDDERAVAQTWPNLASDHIPVFEDILKTFFQAAIDDTQRREDLADRLTLSYDVSFAGLSDALKEFDPTIIIRLHGDDVGVVSQSLSSPPASPATGAQYIVKPPGGGAWTGHPNEIATWTGAIWTFVVPTNGQMIGVIDENIVVIFNGSTWQTSKVPKGRLSTRETQPGRAFEDYDPSDPKASGPAFNLGVFSSGQKVTSYPMFADDYILIVEYPLPAGVLTEDNKRIIGEVKVFLNNALPSWVDFRVFSACGFVLDQDLLDVTAFCT